MSKYQLYTLCGVLLASSALSGCATMATDDTQARFDKACKYASGAVAVAEPVLPPIKALLVAKLGANAGIGLDAFIETVKTTCDPLNPLNLADGNAVIQRVYDAGGNIVALVIQAQTP